jgi:predicted PurR-regulated permease PerM
MVLMPAFTPPLDTAIGQERMTAQLVKIKKDGWRRTVAILATLAAVMLVLALVFYLLIPQVIETGETFIASLPPFFMKVQTAINEFISSDPELLAWVQENTNFHTLDLAGLIKNFLEMAGNSISTIISSTMSAIGGIPGVIFNGVLGIVFAIYALSNKETLARQGRKLAYAFLPETWCDNIVRILRLTNTTFSNFLTGQCIEVCILGCMFAVSMAIFRMPYVLLVSVLVAVTAFIPIVGAFIGCIFGAFFILVNNPLQAVGFVVLFLVLQQIENNLIYPRVVGTSIGLPGMWVLMAVTVGGELMGIAGMFLMIPMASVLYTLLKEITHVRLRQRGIDEEKLIPQPPELNSHIKAKHKSFVEKIKSKKKK